MKHASVSANKIDEIMGSPKFQTDLDSGSEDDASKEPLVIRPIIPYEVTKQKKGRRSMSLNTFQPWPKITQQCYNNL
jgi:hypothetical protein